MLTDKNICNIAILCCGYAPESTGLIISEIIADNLFAVCCKVQLGGNDCSSPVAGAGAGRGRGGAFEAGRGGPESFSLILNQFGGASAVWRGTVCMQIRQL